MMQTTSKKIPQKSPLCALAQSTWDWCLVMYWWFTVEVLVAHRWRNRPSDDDEFLRLQKMNAFDWSIDGIESGWEKTSLTYRWMTLSVCFHIMYLWEKRENRNLVRTYFGIERWTTFGFGNSYKMAADIREYSMVHGNKNWEASCTSWPITFERRHTPWVVKISWSSMLRLWRFRADVEFNAAVDITGLNNSCAWLVFKPSREGLSGLSDRCEEANPCKSSGELSCVLLG